MTAFVDLQAIFEKHRNKDVAVPMAAYMRNHFVFYGIKTPQRNALSKPIIADLKATGGVDWGFVKACWADEHRECQYVACTYLIAVQDRLTIDDLPQLRLLVETKSWWDTIDRLDRIIGNIGLRDPSLDEIMLVWSRDPNFWVRRIAIDHQLLRKTTTNTDLLEQILVNNLDSQEFFINKAIGWALRDYSKTNPAWVEAFIQRYRAQMDSLSIREGSKYLSKANVDSKK